MAKRPGGGYPIIVHVTDLHFGRSDALLVEGLREDLRRIRPELAVVSGDLTMRARRREYREAREFLDTLPCPWMCVPGNHDVPTYNLLERLFWPYRRYRHYITKDLMPKLETDSFAILGLNTARSFSLRSFDWSRGRIGLGQLAAAKAWFANVPERKPRIVFAHHPFILPSDDPSRGLVGRLNQALTQFSFSQIDLLLAGHLHQAFSERIQTADAEETPADERSLLAVQGSTATSDRLRGEPNAYNTIEVRPDRLIVETRVWEVDAFVPGGSVSHELAKSE